MVLTNRLVAMLKDITLTNDTYMSCYRELSLVGEMVKEEADLSKEARQYFLKVCKNIRIWSDVCSDLENAK